MMEMKKILLPFDSSPHSINAAHYALNLAQLMEAQVSIIHCYEWMASIMEVPSPLLKDIESTSKKKAEDILKTAREIFNDRGVRFTCEAIYGAPSRILLQLSQSKEYDLIVMGSHGHSDIAGLFLGSVTHRVLNTIYCPVLVVP